MVTLTATKLTTLACLVPTVAAIPWERRGSPPPRLFVCQGGRCVPNERGLPLSECMSACIPPPNANYTCVMGQCYAGTEGLPKAECDQACGHPGPAPPPGPPTPPNIVQLAESVPALSTLVEALKAANLTGALSGPGPFTVFAPNNKAFGALAPTVLKSLLDPVNRLQLQAVLEYHVAAGPPVYSKALTNHERIRTLEGESVEITLLDGDVFVDRAQVVQADNAASNGVVHIIDHVLQPLLPPAPSGPSPPAPGPGPTGCTQRGCYFSYTVNSSFDVHCGEVNAALRMPGGDFWNDQQAVSAYVDATLSIYQQYVGLQLVQQPCDHDPTKWVLNLSKTQRIEWDGDLSNTTQREGFADFCARRCECALPGDPPPHRPGLRPCGPADKDRPLQHEYCSLCGRKLNQPIDVYFYYPVGRGHVRSPPESAHGIV